MFNNIDSWKRIEKSLDTASTNRFFVSEGHYKYNEDGELTRVVRGSLLWNCKKRNESRSTSSKLGIIMVLELYPENLAVRRHFAAEYLSFRGIVLHDYYTSQLINMGTIFNFLNFDYFIPAYDNEIIYKFGPNTARKIFNKANVYLCNN
jgi:hypothetical protein